jgi:hypothetical protein
VAKLVLGLLHEAKDESTDLKQVKIPFQSEVIAD